MRLEDGAWPRASLQDRLFEEAVLKGSGSRDEGGQGGQGSGGPGRRRGSFFNFGFASGAAAVHRQGERQDQVNGEGTVEDEQGEPPDSPFRDAASPRKKQESGQGRDQGQRSLTQGQGNASTAGDLVSVAAVRRNDGRVGLENLGNTCYMNSSLQVCVRVYVCTYVLVSRWICLCMRELLSEWVYVLFLS